MKIIGTALSVLFFAVSSTSIAQDFESEPANSSSDHAGVEDCSGVIGRQEIIVGFEPTDAPAQNSETASWLGELQDYSELISAFIGALLVFLATQYTEKRSWRRRTQEQLRERQFEKIVMAVKTVNDVIVALNSMVDSVEKSLGGEGKSSTKRTLTEKKLIGQADDLAKRIRALSKNLAVVGMEMKMLRCPTEYLSAVNTAYVCISNILYILDEAVKDQASERLMVLGDSRNSLTVIFDQLVDGSLGKFFE